MTKKPFNGKDQRRNLRRALGVAGTIILQGGKRVKCEVSDISEIGAQLKLETPVVLPNDFLLEIGVGAAQRRCYKTRQNGATAGVRFPERQPGRTS